MSGSSLASIGTTVGFLSLHLRRAMLV